MLWQTPRVLSLQTWTETYMGGERPIETLRLSSFDARTGKRLGLEDLLDLAGERRARFQRLVEERVRAEPNLPLGPDAIPLPEECAVAPDGLVLHWGLFVLGSEEVGMVTVTLPRETLGDLIPPGSALHPGDPHP